MRQDSNSKASRPEQNQGCGSRSAWILIIFRSWIRIRIRIKVKIQKLQRLKKGPRTITLEAYRISLVIDSVPDPEDPKFFLGAWSQILPTTSKIMKKRF
jgi:hypothetical protein